MALPNADGVLQLWLSLACWVPAEKTSISPLLVVVIPLTLAVRLLPAAMQPALLAFRQVVEAESSGVVVFSLR